MAATVAITAYPATFRRATADVVMMTTELRARPLASRIVEVRNMGELQAQFDEVVAEARATGQGFTARTRVIAGRKPSGYDANRPMVDHNPNDPVL